jgi:predicted transposase/invertase (TIGR01784 family)
MAKTKTSKTRKKTLTVKDLGVYIDLKTDFGFKRAFGVKEVLLKFLNSVLDIEGGIVDLQYGNPEILGFSKDERKAVYDLYCITGKKEHIIVEIQSAPQLYFIDRTLVYIARLINKLSEKGKDWNFKLPRIYSINLLDFSFEELTPPEPPEGMKTKKTGVSKFVSRVQLIDCETKKPFYDKLTFYYIELKKFTKEFSAAKTFFEQWIYLIKNMQELDDIPKKLRKDAVFVRLFEIAKIARLTPDEVDKYIKDLNDMNIVKNEIRTLQGFVAQRDNIIAAERSAHAATSNAFAAERSAHAATSNAFATERSAHAATSNALQQANARIAELERMVAVK